MKGKIINGLAHALELSWVNQFFVGWVNHGNIKTVFLKYKKNAVFLYFYELIKKDQEGSLTNNEKKALMNMGKHPRNITKHLKNLK